jgi:hypothetical protein
MRSGTSRICEKPTLKPGNHIRGARVAANQALSGAMGKLDSACTESPPMPASPASVKPQPSRSTAHVSARSDSSGNSRRYSAP